MCGEVFDVSIALEVCHIGQHLGDGLRFTQVLPPDLLLHRSKDEIVIADDGRITFLKLARQLIFKFILMYDDELALGAILARLAQRDQVLRVNVNEQGELPGTRQTVAISVAGGNLLILGLRMAHPVNPLHCTSNFQVVAKPTFHQAIASHLSLPSGGDRIVRRSERVDAEFLYASDERRKNKAPCSWCRASRLI
jgi:hypothetical protein